MLTNLKFVKKIVVLVIGLSVLLFGVALLFLPGPAFVVIPMGLAILATEFVWAKRWLKSIKKQIENGNTELRGWKKKLEAYFSKNSKSKAKEPQSSSQSKILNDPLIKDQASRLADE